MKTPVWLRRLFCRHGEGFIRKEGPIEKVTVTKKHGGIELGMTVAYQKLWEECPLCAKRRPTSQVPPEGRSFTWKPEEKVK